MNEKIFLAIVIVTVLAEDKGYHTLVGIPVAKRIYNVETTASPNAQEVKINPNIAVHNYLVGIVITVGDSFSVCGSSLLSNTRALTAAHCWWDGWRQADQFTLVFGSEYIFVGGTRIDTKIVVLHEDWNPMTVMNDLAMVIFDPVEFSQYVQPINLPARIRDLSIIGSWVQASGYGDDIDSKGFAPKQRQTDVTVQVVPTTYCFNSTYSFMQRTLCTRSWEDVCISHSGGPLTIKYDKKRYLIGVASFGNYSCSENKATMAAYVRVIFNIRWITSKLGI